MRTMEGTEVDHSTSGGRVGSGAASFRGIRWRRALAYGVLCIALLPAFGCIGMTAQLMHVLIGNKVKAEYEGLKEQKVALVVVSDGRGFGPDYSMQILAQLIQRRLELEYKKKITMISQNEVQQALDERARDPDYLAVGHILKADKVVVVEVTGYGLKSGATLFQGNCVYACRVFDVASRQLEFTRGPIPFAYPTTGQPVIDTTERQFEQTFLTELSYRIARYFYDYAPEEDLGRDAIAYR